MKENNELLVELENQVTINAKEIIEKIQKFLKAGKNVDEIELEIRTYLKEQVPQILYFFETVTRVDHPTGVIKR